MDRERLGRVRHVEVGCAERLLGERYLVRQVAVTRVAGVALVAVGLLIAASSIRV